MSALVSPVSTELGGAGSLSIPLVSANLLSVDSLVRVGNVVLGEPAGSGDTSCSLTDALTSLVSVASDDSCR